MELLGKRLRQLGVQLRQAMCQQAVSVEEALDRMTPEGVKLDRLHLEEDWRLVHLPQHVFRWVDEERPVVGRDHDVMLREYQVRDRVPRELDVGQRPQKIGCRSPDDERLHVLTPSPQPE